MKSWKIHALACAIFGIALLALQWPVAVFTVQTWYDNETYSHGFLIPLISAWLIWQDRETILKTKPSAAFRALPLVAALSLSWEIGYQAQAMVVQQYSAVGLFIAGIWTILGTSVFRKLSFPLLFLLLAVPFGESLIPAMMDFTANFTMMALQITGVPVFREGNFLTLPSGHWAVVEACSGLRYLVASVTLGVLFAHLSYRTWPRKLLFILASLVVPVLANGVRAYMIVMIGHLSSMRLATGVDHLIYGWLFFGLVMGLLFWVGGFFRESGETSKKSDAPEAETGLPRPWLAAASVSAIILLSVGFAHHVDDRIAARGAIKADAPPLNGGWEVTQSFMNLTPHYEGAATYLSQSYTKDMTRVALFEGFYRNQMQGHLLVTSTNKLVPSKDPLWGNISATDRVEMIRTERLPIREHVLRGYSGYVMVWEWYWFPRAESNNPYFAKAVEAASRLLDGSDDAAIVIVSTPILENEEAARKALKGFLEDMLPGVDRSLSTSFGNARGS